MSFSVLIPTLNEEGYLGKLLDALVNQTYKDFEVVVVDGGSRDATKEVASTYIGWLNLTFVEAGKKGVGYQKNLAAREASYENFVFVDADIVPEERFLEKIRVHLQEKQVDAAVLYNRPLDGCLFDCIVLSIYNLLFLRLLWHIIRFGTGGVLYVKKDVFFAVDGFDESICIGEDSDIFDRLAARGFKITVFRDVRAPFSMRRWDKVGRLRIVLRYLRFGFSYVFSGPMKGDTCEKYGFGGF